jgi:hypothetical protein
MRFSEPSKTGQGKMSSANIVRSAVTGMVRGCEREREESERVVEASRVRD